MHRCRLSGSIGLGEVRGIGATTVAGKHGDDIGTPAARVLHVLENQHCRAFREYQAGTAFGEWFARRGGIGRIRQRQCSQRTPACNRARCQQRLGAAGDDGVGIAVLDGTVGFTDGHR